MSQLEVTVDYRPSDLVSAALVYKKAVGDTKTFIIIVWIIVVFVLANYLMPPLFLVLLCVPSGTCSVGTWQGFARIGALSIGDCVALLLIAHSGILYRLRMEYTYRLSFLRFRREFEGKKFIVTEEELELLEPSYKITYYWKGFQQVLESQNAFLLPRKGSQYIVES